MYFEFPIEQLEFEFELNGNSNIHLELNGHLQNKHKFDASDLAQTKNTFKIKMIKSDAKDVDSFARLVKFNVNGNDFKDQLKTVQYFPDQKYHAVSPLENNLYFGYIGSMTFEVKHDNDILTRAAWTLANNEFDHIKWPFKGDNYRQKTFANITRDTKFMFTGSLAPEDKDIHEHINNLDIKQLRDPVRTDEKQNIQNWINRSSRIKLTNFDALPNFTFANGINDSIDSFIHRAKKLYLAKKKYFFVGEMLDEHVDNIKDPYTDTIEPGSDVLLEFPSPWYPVEHTMKVITEAKSKNCNIGLDMIWMPLSKQALDLDLGLVDEIFFSMNKTWPVYDIRPGFRWSRRRINDLQTLQTEHCTYQKIQPNIFLSLVKQFEFDFVYDKYKPMVDDVVKTFDLRPNHILWFTHDGKKRHDEEAHTSRHLDLDEFVCVKKLLDYKDKYFW